MMSANIGIDQIVREMMSKDDLSPEFLGGYLNGSKLQVRIYLLNAIVVLFPIELFSLAMMEDGRHAHS